MELMLIRAVDQSEGPCGVRRGLLGDIGSSVEEYPVEIHILVTLIAICIRPSSAVVSPADPNCNRELGRDGPVGGIVIVRRLRVEC